MAKGNSGRVVIEIDPDFKQELYDALEKEGLNLKQWFIQNAEDYLKNRSQMRLNFAAGEEKREEKKNAVI